MSLLLLLLLTILLFSKIDNIDHRRKKSDECRWMNRTPLKWLEKYWECLWLSLGLLRFVLSMYQKQFVLIPMSVFLKSQSRYFKAPGLVTVYGAMVNPLVKGSSLNTGVDGALVVMWLNTPEAHTQDGIAMHCQSRIRFLYPIFLKLALYLFMRLFCRTFCFVLLPFSESINTFISHFAFRSKSSLFSAQNSALHIVTTQEIIVINLTGKGSVPHKRQHI